MHSYFKWLKRWFLLILLVIGLACVLYFRWYEYLSFATLKQYHQELENWSSQHYPLAVLGYMLIYIAAVALSVPGAVFLTLAGGYMFGPIATVYVVISATIGASILFLAVRTAIGKWLVNKASGWVAKMEDGFLQNAFHYLLVLRLVPLFPFWAINIVAALLAVNIWTFVIATLIGIIPGSFVYVMVGNGLTQVFTTGKAPDLHIIFKPAVLLPLIGLAILALVPVVYKKWKGVDRG